MLLCSLYQCLSVCFFLRFLIFCFSLQVHLILLLLSQLYLSVLCFYCTLCSVPHVPSMHHSSSVPFSCCTLSPSTHLNHSQPPTISSLFCILIVFVHLVHPYPRCFCMLYTPCRVLCLIIIATLQLLWWLNPCIHHHWVLC
jgi:hypothetical protein